LKQIPEKKTEEEEEEEEEEGEREKWSRGAAELRP